MKKQNSLLLPTSTSKRHKMLKISWHLSRDQKLHTGQLVSREQGTPLPVSQISCKALIRWWHFGQEWRAAGAEEAEVEGVVESLFHSRAKAGDPVIQNWRGVTIGIWKRRGENHSRRRQRKNWWVMIMVGYSAAWWVTAELPTGGTGSWG